MGLWVCEVFCFCFVGDGVSVFCFGYKVDRLGGAEDAVSVFGVEIVCNWLYID